jgi:NUDIX domain
VEREFSAGGVVVRVVRGRTLVAAIRPPGKPEGVWALPKGNIDPGETPAETAIREVREDTRHGGVRVFKVVSFFLLRAGRGRIGVIEERMKIEVAEARWLPLEEAPKLLAYGGEREMAAKARDRLGA